MLQIKYQDFRELCRVTDNEEWAPGLVVKVSGVWIEKSIYKTDKLLGTEEHNLLTERPEGNHSGPVLPFPCSLKQLQEFLEWSGEYGCIDAFDMADFVRKKIEGQNAELAEVRQGNQAPFKPNPKALDSLLKMVVAMAIDGYGFSADDKKSPIPGEIAIAVQRLGLSIGNDTTRRWLREGAKLLPPEQG